MKPFFSIVIPTFNQGYFLKKCLQSVFLQNFKNFEVIVVDNYSNDITKKIIKKFKKKIVYKKIRNKGIIAKSRNLGIELAKGEWIAFLDSDDTWKKDKLNSIYNEIRKNSFDVICNAEWLIKNNKKRLNFFGPYENNFYKKLITSGNRLSTSASTVKKDFIKKNKILFDESKKFVTCEDYCFFMDIARKKGKFYFLKKALGFHKFHSRSASSNLIKHFKAEEEVLKYHIFKLQNFSRNKKALWYESMQYRKIRNEINDFIKGSKNLNSLNILLMLFINNPIQFIYYLKFVFIKKINEFFYTFFQFR